MVNSTGPRQDPCGTPVVSCFFSERVPLVCICWDLWERYNVNHFKAVPPTPKPKLNFPIRYCGQLCQMPRWGQACQGEWLSGHPCSVKYQTVPSGVLLLAVEWFISWLVNGIDRTLLIWSLNSLTDAFSASLGINDKLLAGLKFGKTISMPSPSRKNDRAARGSCYLAAT